MVAKFLDDNKPKATDQKHHLKVNLLSFKLILVNFSVAEFKRTYLSSEREKENLCVVFTYSTKRATTAKKCTDKRNARAKLLFCQPKPIAFLPFSLPSPLLLKLPIVVIQNCFFHEGTSHFSYLFTNNTQRILMISENLKGFAFRQNELNLKETRFAVYINAVHFTTSNLP